MLSEQFGDIFLFWKHEGGLCLVFLWSTVERFWERVEGKERQILGKKEVGKDLARAGGPL